MDKPLMRRPSQSGFQTPAEEKEAEDWLRYARENPERKYEEDPLDPKHGSPLWAACCRLNLRHELYDAGIKYGEISIEYKLTIGVPVPGRGPIGEGISDEERDARAVLAKDRYWKAVNVLRQADPMAQGVVERVCFNLRPPSYHDDEPLKRGLYSLAVHFGTLKLGINEDKSISAMSSYKTRAHEGLSYEDSLKKDGIVNETRESPISRWIKTNGPVSNVVGAWVKGRW